jgi:gluconokinase
LTQDEKASPPLALLVMGVSGVGKSTVARLLADSLRWSFVEGDDFHSPENIAKMSAGKPLDDDDRRPWLDSLRSAIDSSVESSQPTVFTCSALKERYRSRLGVPSGRVGLIYLSASPDLIAARLASRRGHFMPPGLLSSQFQTLEAPDSPALTLDAGVSPTQLCRLSIEHFGLLRTGPLATRAEL